MNILKIGSILLPHEYYIHLPPIIDEIEKRNFDEEIKIQSIFNSMESKNIDADIVAGVMVFLAKENIALLDLKFRYFFSDDEFVELDSDAVANKIDNNINPLTGDVDDNAKQNTLFYFVKRRQ